MKNRLFNPHRFGLLLRKVWVEDWKMAPYRSIVFPLVFIFFWVAVPFYLRIQSNYSNSGEAVLLFDPDFGLRAQRYMLTQYLFLFVFYMIYSIGMVGKWMQGKKSMIGQLMLPASTLEKYLCMLSVLVLSLFVFYPLCVLASEVLRVGIFSLLYPSLHIPWIDLGQLWGMGIHQIYPTCTIFLSTAAAVCAAGSMLLFGSLLFRKSFLIKSICAAIALVLSYVWIIYQLSDLLFPLHGDFSRAMYNSNLESTCLVLLFRHDETLLSLFLLIMLYFLVLGYYRLKELELLKRW